MATQVANADKSSNKDDVKLIGSATEFLKSYAPASQKNPKDLVDGRYKIQVSSRLPEFDTKMAKAYVVTDDMLPKTLLYALVCENTASPRIHILDAFKNISHPNLQTIVTSGVVSLSQPAEDRFVIVYERPAGQKLSVLLANTTTELSNSFLCNNIIAPLASAINEFATLGLTHGYIHPDNVYYADKPVLGDCITEPCGYSQPFYFEPIERMQATPIAKGEGTIGQDYYALAVLVIYMLLRKEHFAPMSPETLATIMFKAGVYAALTRNKDIPENFYDFFRGLLSYSGTDRWSDRHLQTWLKGKRYNVLLPAPVSEALRPFDIGEIQVSSRREMAHVLFQIWPQIPDYCRDSHLAQWVSISLRNKELADQVARIVRYLNDASAKSEDLLNEQIMYLLVAFDPQGPIRFPQFSFRVDGISRLYAELMQKNAEKELQFLTRFIEMNMINLWVDFHTNSKDNYITRPEQIMLSRIDKIRSFIRNGGYGFGMERILYELNPNLPCQSPLLAGSCVTTLPALLTRLDEIAPRMTNHDPIDKHIAAFIGSRVNMQHEIKLLDLEDKPEIAKNPSVIAVRILASAQGRCGNLRVPGLTHWLALRIIPLMNNLQSRSLRHKVKESIIETARTGQTQRLADLVISSGYANIDRNGYHQAWNLYHVNEKRIKLYRTNDVIKKHSAILASAFSQALAYMALCAVIIGMLSQE